MYLLIHSICCMYRVHLYIRMHTFVHAVNCNVLTHSCMYVSPANGMSGCELHTQMGLSSPLPGFTIHWRRVPLTLSESSMSVMGDGGMDGCPA